MPSMFTAKVKDGVIVTDGIDLPEGETVTVLRDGREVQEDELTPEAEIELEQSTAALDRGEGIPWEQVRAELQRRHR